MAGLYDRGMTAGNSGPSHILAGKLDLAWNDLSKVDGERRKQTLRSIVAINLKKSPGGPTTDSAELATVATEDREFFNRRFHLYEPDIVVCCGMDTANTFHQVVDLGSSPRWQNTSRGIGFHEPQPKRFVISYAHPGARYASNLLHYGLVDAVREILFRGLSA